MGSQRRLTDAMQDELALIADYYRAPAVRVRILEYCGGRDGDPSAMTALALAGYGGRQRLHEPEGAPMACPAAAWPSLLDDAADVCRSLADHVGTLLLLDVDYTNHDDRAEPYRDAARTFRRLEPVYTATLAAFERHGLRPLVLMTGRGYHFTLKAVAGAPLHTSLVGLGPLGASSRARYQREAAALGVPVEMGSAHEGAGRLLEHLAHEVLREVAGRTEVPVTVADLAPAGGGPFICLDLSAYGDPLLVRSARCAFSANQKPIMEGIDAPHPFVLTLPRGGEPLPDLLQARTSTGRAQVLAAIVSARIPAALGGTEWVAAYRRSALARFHRAFDAGPEVGSEQWPYTYDDLDLRTVPACAAFPLEQPNPALLTPAWLRTVALALWEQGWHPRSVAGLVHSRYAQPCGWGSYWQRYDPEARARFYVRLCCGALAAGIEQPSGFTCQAQRERGLCTAGGCGFDLGRLWDGPHFPWRGE